MKNSAFTMAEVLITLGIIGVVAAMTLPTLLNNNRNKALETALREVIRFYLRHLTCIMLRMAKN